MNVELETRAKATFSSTTTVLMAVYNGAQFLLPQLDSIRHQSIAPDEVLICDDASTDNSFQLIQEYIDCHGLAENWTLSRNPSNKGYIENFLCLAERTKSEILMFCDQDDIWEVDKVESLVGSYTSKPDALAIISGYKVIDSKEGKADTIFTRLRANHRGLRQISLVEQMKRNFSVGFALSARRDFYQTLIPVIRKYNLTFDVPVGIFAAASDGYYSFGKALVQRRVHESNVSAPMYSLRARLQNSERHVEGRSTRIQLWESIAKELGSAGARDAEKYINEGVRDLKVTLSALKSRDVFAIVRLFLTGHRSIDRVLLLVDFLVILFGKNISGKHEL